MYLVDTNIFLEEMLSRPRGESCKKFLNLLKEGREQGAVTDFSVYSIMILMDNFRKRKEARLFLTSLAAYKGLQVYNTTLTDKIRAIDICTQTALDIDDAVQYSVAQSLGAEGIVSFDRHFDGLKIRRMEPQAVAPRS